MKKATFFMTIPFMIGAIVSSCSKGELNDTKQETQETIEYGLDPGTDWADRNHEYFDLPSERPDGGIGYFVPNPPPFYGCNLPLGLCELYGIGSTGTGGTEIRMALLSQTELKVEFMETIELDETELSALILSIYPEAEFDVSEAKDYLESTFEIKTDMSFSSGDSEAIIDEAELDGSTLTILEGIYDVVQDEDHDYGYVILSVEIE